MIVSLCNEVLREKPFEEQCRIAAALGYQGLEIAPFTLDQEAPNRLPAWRRQEVAAIAEDFGLAITGLHFLLATPEGLSLTSDSPARQVRTTDVLLGLVELCVDLGGMVMVHGSAAQRRVSDARSPEAARAAAASCLAKAAGMAGSAGIAYCLEPLSSDDTAFINTVAEAADFIDEVGVEGLKTMIDTGAAARQERQDVATIIRDWWPTGKLAHIQFNDRNRRAPGQGTMSFAPIIEALVDVGYDGAIAVEPLVYEPDGPTTAAAGIAYLRGLQQARDFLAGF